jgi:predicted AAA+ superfamily ATPase
MGVSRCGKSTLISIYATISAKRVDEEQIILLNFEDVEFRGIIQLPVADDYIKAGCADRMNYIFLDENNSM